MMKELLASAAIAVAMLGCASVPSDAGMKEISDSVRARGQQELDWQRVAGNEEARVKTLLAEPLDAERAVALAMINSPRLQVTLAEAGIAQAELIEASTIPNPIFGIELRTPGHPYRPFELTLAQSLIELIQLPRRRQLGQLSFEAAKLRLTSEVLSFGAEVRDVYYDALAASQQLTAARLAAETARTSTELAIRQHAAGNSTDLELENEQATYEQAKLEVAAAEERALEARERLIRVTGLRAAFGSWVMASDFPALPSSEMSDQELNQLASSRRLDLEIGQREVELAKRRLPIRRAAAIGDVVVDVHRSREPDGSTSTGPGIDFPIPIFNRGRAARLRAAAELTRAEQTLIALQSEAASEIRAARAHLATARARVEYYRDVVLPRRTRIVELTKIEQNAMLTGVYQLLQARQNEGLARREYIEAQRDYWTARTDLDRALNGTLDRRFDPAGKSDSHQSTMSVTRGEH